MSRSAVSGGGTRTAGACAIALLCLAAPIPARADVAVAGTCKVDADCPGREICVEGSCNLPNASTSPAPTASGTTTAVATVQAQSCTAEAECGTDACVNGVCVEHAASAEHPWPTQLGLVWGVSPGLSGKVSNPAPLQALAFELGTGDSIRYHLWAGYENLNGFDGIALAPTDWGFAFPVQVARRRLVIEPVLEPAKIELFLPTMSFQNVTFAVSSAALLRVTLDLGRYYVALEPFGLEARYFTIAFDTASNTAYDWRMAASAGVQL